MSYYYLAQKDAALSATATAEPDINVGTSALVAIWILTSISTLIVVLRCYTQRFISRQLGPSDALAVLSSVVLIITASFINVQYHYGWGRHSQYISHANSRMATKYNIIMAGFGIMGATFGRMSFIILMVKLFSHSAWRRRALWVLFGLQFVLNSIVAISTYVQCKDIRSQWDYSVISKCWPATAEQYIGYVHSAFNGSSDLFLTVLPAIMLWNLQQKLQVKIGLAFLLCLSALAFIAVIMKLVYIQALGHKGDYLYNTVPLFLWVIIENALVLIASSAPFLRPFKQKFWPTQHSITRDGYRLDNYGMYGKSTGTTNNVFSNHKVRNDSEEGIVKQVDFTMEVDDIGASRAPTKDTAITSFREDKL